MDVTKVRPSDKTPLLSDAPFTAVVVPSACQMTREELQKLLERADYGKNEAVFQSYFRPSPVPGGPPVCSFCNRSIAEHAGTGPSAISPFMPSEPVDPNALPTGMVRVHSVDRYKAYFYTPLVLVSMFLFSFGFIMLLVFLLTGVIRKGGLATFTGPLILLLMGLVFGFIAGRVEITFDHIRREWTYRQTRFWLPCVSCNVASGSFNEILGVTHKIKNRGVVRIMLRVRGEAHGAERTLDVQEGTAFDIATPLETWKNYIERNLHVAAVHQDQGGIYGQV
jgi:hypothetical protein